MSETGRYFSHRGGLQEFMVSGPYAGVLDELALGLQAAQYAPGMVSRCLRAARHVTWCLEHGRILRKDLTEVRLRGLSRSFHPTCDCPHPEKSTSNSRSAVLHLLTVLRRRGLADQPLPKPFAKELGDFRDYQREVRGVADETWQIRERHLTIVLSALMPGGRFDLKKLAPKAINALVLRTIDEGHRTTAGNLCTTTRAFFQYLRATGHRDVPEDAGIFAPKKRRRWPSAKALTVEQLRLLLLPLRADTAMAARDFAVLAVLARTGLRRVDLSRLTLDDFDGRAGTLTVRRNKSRVGHVVPLTPDARAALLTYVAKYRRESPCRSLFLSESYPFHEGLTARGVAAITERAFARAGIQHVSRGAHVFRHTLVTHLVAQRAPPKAIADLIIHTSIETTALYTRIDLQRLKDVTRQWSHGAHASAGIERSQS